MKNLKFLFLTLILVCGLKLFDLNVISSSIANSLALFSFFLIILGLVFQKQKIKYNYDKLIYIFFTGLGVNFMVMYLYNNSSLYDSAFGLINYAGLLTYFFLNKYNYSEKSIIKIVIYLAIVVSILMITQQIVKPKGLFNQLILHENFLHQRGTVRVRIPGMALVVFSYFLFLFKFVKTNKVVNVFICLFFLIVIVLQGFRSVTLSLIICSVFLYWFGTIKRNRISVGKILSFSMLIVFVFFAFMQIEYVKNIVVEMFLQVEEDKNIGGDNVRLASFFYYLGTIKQSFWMYITGNGIKLPHRTPEGLFAVDLGIFGFFALAGFLPTYALIKTFLKGLLFAKKNQYMVVSTFFLYMFINSFLFNAEALRVGIFHIFGVFLYLIDLKVKEKKNTKKIINLKNNYEY